MGCNTSKDSIEPRGEKEKHDEEINKEEKTKQGNQVNTNNISGIPHESNDFSVACTNYRKNSVTTKSANGDQSSKSDQVTTEASCDKTSEPEVNEEQAATKIQAVFRGHKARQSMKQPAHSGSGEPVTNNSSTMAEEAKETVEELTHAATKIQATYRGHLTRKHEAEKKGEPESTSSKGEGGISKEEELDIDLTDPDLNKAAVKIQASFRGHMVRKENEDEHEQNATVSK